jgi:hypothetical protein
MARIKTATLAIEIEILTKKDFSLFFKSFSGALGYFSISVAE